MVVSIYIHRCVKKLQNRAPQDLERQADMYNIKEALKLYAVTDDRWLTNGTLAQQVEEAILGGATMVQFREKNKTPKEKKEAALEIQKICKKYQVPFLINDNVELAIEIGADGVHLGQSDMDVAKARQILGRDAIIGATAKTVLQAKTAQEKGADYLGSGAVFGTTTKEDAVSLSREKLIEICESVTIPVVAIGGITTHNAAQLQGCPIAGIAVVGGLFAQKDIRKAAEDLRGLFS